MESHVIIALYFGVSAVMIFAIGVSFLWPPAKDRSVPLLVYGLTDYTLVLFLTWLASFALSACDYSNTTLLLATAIVSGMWILGAWQMRALSYAAISPPSRRHVVLMLAAMWCLTVVRTFLFDVSRVDTAAMEPTLHPDEAVWVQKFAYGVRLPFTEHKILRGLTPELGDVVAFTSLPGSSNITGIARVVGLPGNRVERFHADLLTVTEVAVRPGEYLLAGDNRALDHKKQLYWMVKESTLVGKVTRTIGWRAVEQQTAAKHGGECCTYPKRR